VSDLYRLANGLRKSSDAFLERIVQERSLEISNYKDFFDFAEAILQPKSLGLALAGISATELAGLRALISQQRVSKEILELLDKNLLIDNSDPTKPKVYDWLIERLTEQPKTSSIRVIPPARQSPEQESIDRDAGIAAFEAMQAITEILFDFDLHLVRDVSKGSMGLPDVKRLASHLRKEKDYVKSAFEMAKLSGVIALRNGRWVGTQKAGDWFEWSAEERWQLLAGSWQQMTTNQSSKEILEQLKTNQGCDLPRILREIFPLSDNSPNSRVLKLSELANFIGLTGDGFAASWLESSLKRNLADATRQLRGHLPKEQSRLIVQADLSLVAPGPLPARTEVLLRKFADTESIGLASSYRLSALSLSCGMEAGVSAEEIEALLVSLNAGALPQPVDYLIRETKKRFGKLRVLQTSSGEGSTVQSADDFLLRQLARDSKLRALSFSEANAELVSSAEPEVVYHGLREAGYLAIRVDGEGLVVSPVALHQNEDATQGGSIISELARLRKQDGEIEQESPAQDMERKIQLALKNKSTLNIEITSVQGELLKFTLEPIGLANGRLRAKDRKADIERTLPISSITSISIG
jgi:hypothetical protein